MSKKLSAFVSRRVASTLSLSSSSSSTFKNTLSTLAKKSGCELTDDLIIRDKNSLAKFVCTTCEYKWFATFTTTVENKFWCPNCPPKRDQDLCKILRDFFVDDDYQFAPATFVFEDGQIVKYSCFCPDLGVCFTYDKTIQDLYNVECIFFEPGSTRSMIRKKMVLAGYLPGKKVAVHQKS